MKKFARPKPLSLPPSRPVEMTVGAYRPCFEIGAGGMATVYIARESGASGLRRTVALKLMHEHLTRNERFKKRFLDEARVLTNIAHPYVCRVVGFGEDAGRPFMAMEYLVGEPLSRVLRAMKRRVHGLPVATRARLFARVIADIAEGMHAAHETCDPQGRSLGVVHRDVSPQNLFLLYDGTVRILDFGIARFRDRYVQTATTGRLIGKLPYMAPEQIQGTAYDRRVDVWALGIVFWELVTLDRLFRRETEVRTMEAVCSDPIPKASEVVEGVPDGLDEILGHALERNPELRYQTAADFARALEMWLARTGQPVTHADLSQFLNGFFPGSQNERRRWAEEATPDSGVQVNPEIDFARDVLGLEDSSPSLSLPKLLPRSDELISAEHTPTLTYARPPRDAATHVEASNSASSHANIGAVTVSVAEEGVTNIVHARTDTISASQRWRSRLWHFGAPTLALGFGVLIGVTRFTNHTSTGAAVLEARAAAALAPPAAAFEHAGLHPNRVVPNAVAPSAATQSPAIQNEAANAAMPNAAAPNEAKPSSPVGSPAAASAAVPGVTREPAPAGADKRATSTRTQSANGTARGLPAPTPPGPALGTGDVLVVSATPGLSVYLGGRLLGQTPLRTRLPAGVAQLSVQLSATGPRSAITAKVAAGQLNIVSLK